MEFEADQYIDLGESDRFRQRVLAFSAWTSYSPTWEENADGTVDNGAPPFMGSTLGGVWRMKGYPWQRFNDKAAIYYSTELRLIPDWNPLENWAWFQERVGVEWIQIVPFAELGRVAPSWNLSELHTDMKWDVGLGLRAFARGLVVRVDAAVSEESVGIQMMIGQPFQF